MIRGFKRETELLSNYEKEKVLPLIVSILEGRVGKANCISNKEIIKKTGPTCREWEARVRKVINYIRNQGIIPCLIAGGHGYYIAADAKDVTDYEESLKSREAAIRSIRLSIHKQGLTAFGEDVMKSAAEETLQERKEEEKKYKLQLKLKREQKLKQEKKKKRKSVLRLRPRKHY